MKEHRLIFAQSVAKAQQAQAAASARGLSSDTPVIANPVVANKTQGLPTTNPNYVPPAPAYKAPTGVIMPTLTPQQQQSQNEVDLFGKGLNREGAPIGTPLKNTATTGSQNNPYQTYSINPSTTKAIVSMRGQGLTDQQIRNNLSNPDFLQLVGSGKELTGTFDEQGNYQMSADEQLARLPSERDAAIAAERAAGFDGSNAAQQYSQRETALRKQSALDQSRKQAQQDTNLGNAVHSSAGGEPITSTTHPTVPVQQDIGTSGATPQLIDTTSITDPQALQLAQAYNDHIKALGQNMTSDIAAKNAAIQANTKSFNEQDAILAQQRGSDLLNEQLQQNNLDAKLEQDKRNNDLAEAAARTDLAYKEQQDLRQASIDRGQAVMETIAKLAMTGGVGSTGGLAELTAINDKYEQKMSDIKSKFGVDSIDLIAKFSGIFIKAQDDWTTATNQNIKDTAAALQTNTTQKLASKKARAEAEQTILSKFQEQQDKNNTEMATTKENAAKEMQTINENAKKFAEQVRQFNMTDKTKRDAIAAAANARTTQQAIAAGVHDDAMTQTDSAGIQAAIAQAQSKLAASTSDYAVYNNVTAFKHQFDAAYGTFFGIDPATGEKLLDPKTGQPVVPTAAQRATADGQMAFQFSHSQNPGSLRIQDVAAAMAEGNQSVADKISATIQHAADGGGVLTDGIRQTMFDLIAQHYSDAQSAATNQILTEWNTLKAASQNYPKARKMPDPTMLTSDPALLNAMYATQNQGLSSFLHGGSSSSSGSSTPTGSFFPSAQMKGGVSTTIGTRTVSGTPEMLAALQSADAAMFKATGQHLQINSDYRSTAQQQQAYNDFLSGKIARAAPPGQSLHEKGLAADITNWKEAEPYLVAAGLSPLGAIGSKIRSEDPGHFQLGSYSGGNSTNIASVPDTSNIDELLQIAMAD